MKRENMSITFREHKMISDYLVEIGRYQSKEEYFEDIKMMHQQRHTVKDELSYLFSSLEDEHCLSAIKLVYTIGVLALLKYFDLTSDQGINVYSNNYYGYHSNEFHEHIKMHTESQKSFTIAGTQTWSENETDYETAIDLVDYEVTLARDYLVTWINKNTIFIEDYGETIVKVETIREYVHPGYHEMEIA
jgi:hypothetical protein